MNDVFDTETGEKLELLVRTPAASAALTLSPKHQPSKNQPFCRERHSQRVLGDCVDWKRQQVYKETKAEKGFRESLAGVRHELRRPGLSDFDRLNLTSDLLEKTKSGYARHVQMLVVEELEREIAREVELRLELESLGHERMRRRHDRERSYYRKQISRVREECEMALAAAAAKNNLLR